MCFEFSSCFGGSRDDYGGERANRHEEDGGRRRGRRGNNNRNGYYAGGDHKAASDEAGHKAYHDNASAGDRGRYATYAQHKADTETPKLPAWHNKVSDDAYTTSLKQEVATDYHHYPTSTTTTSLGR